MMRTGVSVRVLQLGPGNHIPAINMRSNISLYAGLSCFLLSVASILYLVSFASPYWFVSTEEHNYMRSGLWSTCQTSPGTGNKSDFTCGDTKDYIDTGR